MWFSLCRQVEALPHNSRQWFTVTGLGSHSTDPWDCLSKDKGLHSLYLTHVRAFGCCVSAHLDYSAWPSLLPAHLCSIAWVTLQCGSWFLLVSAGSCWCLLTTLHLFKFPKQISFVMGAQWYILEWGLGKDSKHSLGSSWVQKDLCSQCKSQKCWYFPLFKNCSNLKRDEMYSSWEGSMLVCLSLVYFWGNDLSEPFSSCFFPIIYFPFNIFQNLKKS